MSMSSLNLIRQSAFELESGNENVDGQTADRWTDGHRTHQSNRRVGYTQPPKNCFFNDQKLPKLLQGYQTAKTSKSVKMCQTINSLY